MIADLKPYPDYKDSGLQWLGNIPRHWEIKPGFAAFREKKVKNIGLREKTVLSLSYGRIVVKPSEKLHGLVPDSFETYQIVDPGDIIIRSTDLQNDWNSLRVGLVRNRGIITSAYLCFKVTDALIPEYGYQMLHAFDLMKVFYGMGSGLRQNLDFSDFKRMLIFVPPPDEQSAIVRFLDYVNRRLERTIRAQRKVISLLNEQKQAIIHRAATRGLDPNVPLKPSGIPWLGEIPAHWEVRKLKQCITRIEQGWSPQCDAQQSRDDEWGVLKVGCVNKEVFDGNQNKKLPATLLPELGLEILDGDILVSRANTRELLGLAALAEKPRRKLILCDKLFRFRALPESFHPRFLVYSLRCKPSRAQIESSTNGASSSMQNIGQGVLKNLWIFMPPIKEQESIVNTLSEQTRGLDVTIAQAEREIALLREYRTRLIADVVTGKLDVREAARQLPIEADEPETPIESDQLDEGEESFDADFEMIGGDAEVGGE